MPTRTVPNLPAQNVRLQAVPQFVDFVSAAEQLFPAGDTVHETFWNCEALLRALARSGSLCSIINAELKRILTQPFYGPPASGDAQFTLYVSDSFTLSLLILDENLMRRERLQGVTRHCILVPLGPSPLVVDLYEQPRFETNDIFDRSSKLVHLGWRAIGKLDSLKIQASRIVADLTSQAGTTLVLSLLSSPLNDIMWEYDRDTLLPCRAVSESLSSSRIEYALNIVSEIGTADCVPYLIELFNHPAYFIRWSVVKNVMRLDEKAGLEMTRSRAIRFAPPCAARRSKEQGQN